MGTKREGRKKILPAAATGIERMETSIRVNRRVWMELRKAALDRSESLEAAVDKGAKLYIADAGERSGIEIDGSIVRITVPLRYSAKLRTWGEILHRSDQAGPVAKLILDSIERGFLAIRRLVEQVKGEAPDAAV